jgi:hypothetical protein
MSSPKTLNATALILMAVGIVLIGIAAIVTLEARPTSPPAGNALSGASSGQPIARASTSNFLAANNSAGVSIGAKPWSA